MIAENQVDSYPRAIVLTGPTASGKSKLAIKLAQSLRGAIANLDSVQLYRGFDIGSAKPNTEERKIVPHLLFDVVSWQEEMDAAKFAMRAKKAWAASKVPLVFTGGTGLYLRSLLEQDFHPQDASDPDYKQKMQEMVRRGELAALYQQLESCDPDRAAALHPNDHVRIVRALEIVHCTGMQFAAFSAQHSSEDGPGLRTRCYWIHLNPCRDELRDRIRERTRALLKRSSLQHEVLGLLRSGVSSISKPMRTIGYKQVIDFFRGDLSSCELEDRIFYATCQYAKRQRTWFAKTTPDVRLESFGDGVESAEILQQIENFMALS